MKALFVYSTLSGFIDITHYLSLIERKLKEKFQEVKMLETHNQEELKKACLLASNSYEYLIFSGGDGAVSSIINYLAPLAKRPILGYIPTGTTNDFAKNFHLSSIISKALKNIINGIVVPFDIIKVNNRYAAYVIACGAFSEIPYTVKRKTKKAVGGMAYYLLAMKDAFVPQKVTGTLKCNGKTYDVHTPFLLILNSNHVGGFYVNVRNKVNDGKFMIYITKPGIFNGLLHYLFFKVRTTKILTDSFTFTYDGEALPWDIDGELVKPQNVNATCLSSHLKIIVSHRTAKKIYKQSKTVVME